MKKLIIFCFAVLLSLLFSNTAAFAENFYIDNYKVKINVTEQNVAQVTEELDVFFTKSSHGIFRTIPLQSNIRRADGTGYTAKNIINNIYVNEPYNAYYDSNGEMNIKIGEVQKYVKGPKKYIIKYDLHLGNDKLRGEDEFYFNIIGTGWAVDIRHAEFEVLMPKEFNPDNVGLSVGKYGVKGFDGDAEFSVNDKSITGFTKRVLNPYEGITIRITLPDKYFTPDLFNGEENKIGTIILFTLIAFAVWFFCGKDDHVTPVVNFYPPEDKNSAEIGVEYSGFASDKDVISLIFYLASKGYLEIDDDSKYGFTIRKTKEYEGNNPVEKVLMKALFKDGDEITKAELETSTDFHDDYNTCIAMLSNIKNSIFEKKPLMWLEVIIILACLVGIAAVLAEYQFQNLFIILFFSVFICVGLGGLVACFKAPNWGIKIFLLIWSSGFAGIPLFMLYSFLEAISPVTIVAAVLCEICCIICLVNLPKRNQNGNKILGEILGFRKFLEVAEKARLERLVRQNPSYCYDVLPYAYVLGISDVWIKKFESIVQEPPQWYKGSQFNAHRFNTLTHTLCSISTPMQSGGSSHSSSHGGGGHSGGGHGGGGGGSW